MLFYSYKPETMEYNGTIEGVLDPLESEKQKKDIYLQPANTTTKEPPAKKELKALVWNGQKWNYNDDYRRLNLVNPKTGESYTMQELGKPKAGFYPVKEPRYSEYYTIKIKDGWLYYVEREPTVEEYNEKIRQQREARMVEEADGLFYKYMEAIAKGEPAEELKAVWLEKKEQIRHELPYKVE